MSNGAFRIPDPRNEPVLSYAPGAPERAALKARLTELSSRELEIPLVIGGREVRTGRIAEVRVPHRHGQRLARFHQAGPAEVQAAIEAALQARKTWSAMPPHDRAAVLLKAADLLAGPWRQTLNAATMLGQSKTPYQAEIDAACEIIDFWRWNPHFMERIHHDQPVSPPGQWNRTEYRALEGFVFAVTPFNFTSIAANLPTAPALMGNTVVWKPASSAIYSAWHVMKLLEAAGLPPGVINFVPGPGRAVGDPALASADLAGLHFTGSTGVFQQMWRTIGENLPRYHGYPRIVGETGGKDFVFVHPSADVDAAATALVRGAFEYQGQKCSAASRAYVPESLWPQLRERLLGMVAELKMGEVEDFTTFMGAVIDRGAFDSIRKHIGVARSSSQAKILAGGGCDDSKGFFIEPTVIETVNPHFKLMEEEIFGPVLTVYVYADIRLDEALELCSTTSPYGLTGAIFARDREAVADLTRRLADAAGNFYVNDKPTGAVVGQQPFGGARASGTNDKAGSIANLYRWVSIRAIKETFDPAVRFEYPYMREK
ncbi:L-glutamate gamma-semialdehyde dehydrogenase [Anaeromyxobacter dehalogenans]|uniref:L-glutamate gamma-semialdehyde dehydrogenase n=1 Tax=Anaeromyxobacter dehalogenans (strain 2CP-C) TaxID=290397 RepID=Q2IP72_ANADE|nr:L-glutamate gamma-semialdehyde dehydrogenase [Anaeromyxobacter dehalogenans]ABC80606.1 delta-1-pyrroline-5-carboxylate dehydrogenase [Anaeromyxobacter dehalogenans 2CP-C]